MCEARGASQSIVTKTDPSELFVYRIKTEEGASAQYSTAQQDTNACARNNGKSARATSSPQPSEQKADSQRKMDAFQMSWGPNPNETHPRKINLIQSYEAGQRDFCGLDLQEIDLTDMVLPNSRFILSNLKKSKISYANLSGTTLTKANLQETDLFGANLMWAKLRKANLRRADLRGADLRNADLREADLREANLLGANLLGAKLIKTRIDETTRISATWRMIWEIVNGLNGT